MSTIKQHLNEALSTCEKLLDNQSAGSQSLDNQNVDNQNLDNQNVDNQNVEQAASPESAPREFISTTSPQTGIEWMQACQTVANILTSMGFVQEAYPWRSMALDQAPNSAKFYAESGRVCSQCEDWEQAIYFCQRTLEYAPDSVAIHRQLARVYHQLGDFDAKAEIIKSLLTKRPDKANAEEHYKFGQVLRGQEQTQAAIDAYQRAIEQDSQYAIAYCAMGDLLAQQGNQAETVELFSRMVEQLPDNAQAHYRLGRAYRQTQQPERAIEEFQAAIALNSQLQWPYMGLIDVQMQRGLFDEAIATCRNAIKVFDRKDESIAWAYYYLGNAAAKKGEQRIAALAHQKSFSLRGWQQVIERDYQFGLSWFSDNIPIWSKYLEPFNEQSELRHPLQALSLGAQNDGSLFWLVDRVLTEPDDRLICISDRVTEQFQQNRARLLEPGKLVIQTGNELADLEELPEESIDFACIHSYGKQADYLKSVSALIWQSLKPSGLIFFKHYRWQHPSDPKQSSKVGIDDFIASVSGNVEVLCRNHQVILRKER